MQVFKQSSGDENATSYEERHFYKLVEIKTAKLRVQERISGLYVIIIIF